MKEFKAYTPIDVDRLRNELVHYPDKNFVQYLTQGLLLGFDTGFNKLPTVSLECKNSQSARFQPEITSQLIESELSKGYIIGPFKEIPYSIYRINPLGVATGKYSKKNRLTVDLSSPHDNLDHDSLNDLIDKKEYSLSYITIDQAIQTIKETGKGCSLLKTDISDAFKLIPIHPSLWKFHGIKWDDNYYFYKQLVFGSRSSPKIFDNLSSTVCWIAQYITTLKTSCIC